MRLNDVMFIVCPSLMCSLCVLVCSVPSQIACADIKSTSHQSDSSKTGLRRGADSTHATHDIGRPRSDIASVGTCKGTGLSAELHRHARCYVIVLFFRWMFLTPRNSSLKMDNTSRLYRYVIFIPLNSFSSHSVQFPFQSALCTRLYAIMSYQS